MLNTIIFFCLPRSSRFAVLVPILNEVKIFSEKVLFFNCIASIRWVFEILLKIFFISPKMKLIIVIYGVRQFILINIL